jgi:hypothetical protein
MADAKSISVRFSYRKTPLPPLELLFAEAQRVYSYDTNDGGLLWRTHKNPRRPWPPLGSQVGGDDGHGYRMCLLLGHKFKVHQIVWLMQTGKLPHGSIDHIDGDKRNNRIENLRVVTDHQNSMNLRNVQSPTTGIKDQRSSGKNLKRPYAAVVQHLGKKRHFGAYATKAEAREAYIKGKRLLCGEYSPV